MAKNQAPRRRGFTFIPFSDAPPVMLNYYMYLVTIIAFAVAVAAQKLTLRMFIIHALISFAILMGFNFFVHCMLFGDCMRTALAIVTLLQIAQIAWFIRDLT